MTIILPEEIATRLDLSLVEKVALSIIVRYPRCANQKLARELGLSIRGVENLLVRLRRRGLIEQFGKGSARALKLTFPVEHHTLCGAGAGPQGRTECGTDAISKDLAVAIGHKEPARRPVLAAACQCAIAVGDSEPSTAQ